MKARASPSKSGYASSNYPLLSAAFFMLTILSAGTFAGWLRMRSVLSGESGVIPCTLYGFVMGVSAWWLKKSVGEKTH